MEANNITKRTLRLKKSLDSKVTESAKQLGISVNAYIIMILSKELCKEK